MADAQVLEVEGPDGPRQVRVSSPDRLMWPDAGITKLDLANYVVAVGDPPCAGQSATARSPAAFLRRHRR